MNTKAQLNEQIKKYEAFLNETLRGDLLKVTTLQEELVKKLANYEEIRQFISSIKSGEIVDEKNCIKTQVDLGCNFYCQAKIVSTQRIILYLGLNFYLEFTLDEALNFIEKKKQLLNSENEDLIKKSCEIKANIKLVLDTLRQLQGIDAKDFYKPRIDL